MADRTNLEILLSEWGHWKARANNGGLGFPANSPFVDVRVDGKRRADPEVFMVDEDLRRLDEFIAGLFPDARVIVMAHYIWEGKTREKIERLGVLKSVYYSTLDFTHKQLSHRMGGKYATEYMARECIA